MITLGKGGARELKSEQPYISRGKKANAFLYTEAKNTQIILLYKILF